MGGDLIARLEAASEGGRDLDLWLEGVVAGRAGKLVGTTRDVPAYTTSLDAALALAERVLPGWAFVLSTGAGDNPAWVQAYPQPANEDHYQDAVLAGSLPLALCVAILRARVADSGGSGPSGYGAKRSAPEQPLNDGETK